MLRLWGVAAAGVIAAFSAAQTAQAEGLQVSLGVEGSILQHYGDDFEGVGPTGIPSLTLLPPGETNVEPEDGWGGRLWADVLFSPNLMVRGSLNGAWLDGEQRVELPSASFIVDQQAEIDAWWATFEGFYLWRFGRPVRPHTMVGLGGGLEYADVENRFEELTTFRGDATGGARQESDFQGLGPRISGIIDHELGQSGLHIFGEVGVAYLIGDRDDDFEGFSFSTMAEESDSDGGNVWHFGTRLGVGYVVPLGGADFRIDVGWRHDIFNQSNNVLFLPENRGGDTNFGGPFVAASVALPL
jgi:hypothetical protein